MRATFGATAATAVAIGARNLLLAELIASYVEQLQRMHVVGATDSPDELLLTCQNKRPGLLIVDCGHPRFNTGFLAQVAVTLPGVPAFLLLHRSAGNEVAHLSMRLMDVQYVYWEDHSLATWRVALGESSSRVTIPVGDSLSRPTPPRRARALLSDREAEVLAHAAAGLTNGEIAERLGVKPATVKTHLDRMAQKLGVRARAGLVRVALEQGLLEGPWG